MLPDKEARERARDIEVQRNYFQSKHKALSEAELEIAFLNRKFAVLSYRQVFQDGEELSDVEERIGKDGLIVNEPYLFNSLEEAENAMDQAEANFGNAGPIRRLTVELVTSNAEATFI